MPYLDARWMVRETMRFLGDAELEHPKALRATVAATARSLADEYGVGTP
jgi:predicted DNA-binding transcriptional regulator YafY